MCQLRLLCICVSPAVLDLKGQDRSTGLEAHLVSANSKYIQEQQEQQQVERENKSGWMDKKTVEEGKSVLKEKEWMGVGIFKTKTCTSFLKCVQKQRRFHKYYFAINIHQPAKVHRMDHKRIVHTVIKTQLIWTR